ncbi:MAG: LysM peptidoglycan-binding domain-containing protein [Lachnospiraceae bacterium]|nr:LysM peptidoglycan-binding domain-containing protein [Lachnospiraceae bacterium]
MMNTVQMTSDPAMIFSYHAQRRVHKTPDRHHCGYYQRSKQRRQHILIFAVITIFLLTACVLIGSNFIGSSNTQANNTKEIYKYYTSIEVQDGDSLWSIADRYITADYPDREAYIKELAALNNLSDTTIHSGSYLTIPYYSDIEK